MQPPTPCTTCGTPLPPEARFCPTCGHARAQPEAAPPGPAAPAPSGSGAADARNWGVIAHLSALVGLLGIPTFVGPLVVWLTKRETDPFVAAHSAEALNFNLSLLLYGALGLLGSVLTLGLGLVAFLPLLVVGGILWLVFTVMGAVKASNGQPFRYPSSIRFIS